ncbi:MAG: 8-oxo-dGTP diphosphatase [Oscillospiraceae bacterium]|nr:8-oxo-dGTP diphosphatase [Oscillospiraceae bacterium]
MIETTLCYLERGEEVLLLHRTKKPSDPNEGKWIGVGGKLEPGETPEACMRREIREETGLRVTEHAYRGIVEFLSDVWPAERMHLFTVTAWEGTQQDCDEGVLQWIPKERMESLPMWEGDRVFLRLLRENAPFFRLRLVYEGELLVKAEVVE